MKMTKGGEKGGGGGDVMNWDSVRNWNRNGTLACGKECHLQMEGPFPKVDDLGYFIIPTVYFWEMALRSTLSSPLI